MLSDMRDEVAARMEEGWEAAERDEVLTAEESIAQSKAFREEWLRKNRPSCTQPGEAPGAYPAAAPPNSPA